MSDEGKNTGKPSGSGAAQSGQRSGNQTEGQQAAAAQPQAATTQQAALTNVSAEQIRAYLAQNPSVLSGGVDLNVTMDEDLKKFIEDMTDKVTASSGGGGGGYDNLKEFAAGVAYQGLDTVKLRAWLAWKARTNFPQDAHSAIKRLIVLGLVRGNNASRIRTTVSDAYKPVVEQLLDTFMVKDKPSRTGVTVTLSRVVICYAELAAFIAQHIEVSGVVPGVDQTYPHCMRHSAFSSLIPISRSENELKIYKAFVYYSTMTSSVLDRKHPPISKELLTRQEQFVEIGLKQSPISEVRRKAVLETGSLKIYINSVLAAAISSYAAEYDRLKGV